MARLASMKTVVILAIGLVVPINAGIVFDPVLNTCGNGGTVLDEVVKMANSALNYMNNAQSNFQQGPNSKGIWDYYRVATLFDVLFDSQSPGADVRWNTVQSNLQAMADLVNYQPDVYVFCDDTQFFTNTPTNGGPTQFRNPVSNEIVDVCQGHDPG